MSKYYYDSAYGVLEKIEIAENHSVYKDLYEIQVLPNTFNRLELKKLKIVELEVGSYFYLGKESYQVMQKTDFGVIVTLFGTKYVSIMENYEEVFQCIMP